MVVLSFQTVLGPEQTRVLADTRFTDVRFLDAVDSTNRMLVDLAEAGAGEGLVLVADEQTAGRGRLGRTWQAAPGTSLLVSALLRPDLPPERLALLTVAAGVAAVEACRSAAGVSCSLKWPNDVVAATPAGERKLAGILAEAVLDGGRPVAAVVGMGLNLRRAGLPPELAETATALDELGSATTRNDLLVAWLRELDRCYGLLAEGTVPDLLRAYRQRCGTIGRRVRVHLSDGFVDGVATAVTDEGHLQLDTSDGPRTVTAGDVVHLRPGTTA